MNTTPPDTLAAALSWHNAGASVVRVATDGTKRPFGAWAQYQQQRPTEQDLHAWFSHGHPGIGIVLGAVSGGMEMLEFEGRAVAEGQVEEFTELADNSGLGDLWRQMRGYTEQTPSGGLHIIYRVTDGPVLPNTKLARRPSTPAELEAAPNAKVQVLLETRGEGGFVVTAPSHGSVHPTGRPWFMRSGSIETVPEITAYERDALFTVARALDQMPEPTQAPAPAVTPRPMPGGDLTPGDDYEARTTWTNILTPHGWQLVFTSGCTSYWRRPGKTIGFSATTGRDPQRDRLYVFTTSTEFQSETPYTKFGAYAVLHHGGNHSEAARDLRRRGYGSRSNRHLSSVRPTPPPTAEAHGTTGALALSAQRNDQWTAPEEPPVLLPVPMPAREWDDMGNAERVIDRYGSEIRWLADIERWACYETGRWTLRSANTGVWTRVVSTINQLGDEADNYSDETPAPDPNSKSKEPAASEQEKFLAWARKQRMRPKLAAARDVLQAYPAVHSTMAAFDKPEMLLNVSNGIVDLTTGGFLPHDRALYLMQQSPVAYDPDATCPMWEDFLASVMPDADRRAYLARVVGYSLTGATSEQVMFIHHGEGQNGKGVFMRVTMSLLGDYAQAVPGSTLMAKHTDGGIPNDIARMVGKRLLSTSETGRTGEGRGKKLDEELVKRLTGEDVISARFLNAEFFDFRPVGKIHLATNHLPDVSGSHSMARRLQDIGWDVIVPPAKRITNLDEKIIAREAAGVLNWAIRGCLDWQKQGLAVPASVEAKTREHIAQSNPLATWLEEQTDEVRDSVTENGQLYASYKAWADKAGVRNPMSMKAFTTHLQEKGFQQSKDSRTRRATTLGLALAVLGGDR